LKKLSPLSGSRNIAKLPFDFVERDHMDSRWQIAFAITFRYHSLIVAAILTSGKATLVLTGWVK
jgi:hypothetical protein